MGKEGIRVELTQTTLNGEMEDNPIEQLRKVKERISFILDKYPPTRDDDRVLLRYYYRIFEPYVTLKVSELTAMTTPESITRCRRKVQEKGQFMPSDQVAGKRRRREQQIHDGIRDL